MELCFKVALYLENFSVLIGRGEPIYSGRGTRAAFHIQTTFCQKRMAAFTLASVKAAALAHKEAADIKGPFILGVDLALYFLGCIKMIV